MTNALLETNERIDVEEIILSQMRAYVDIGKYWPEGLSVNAAYEQLLIKGLKVDQRTLNAARKGILSRSEYITLIRLRDWIRDISDDRELKIDDLLVLKEDEE